MKFVDEAVVKVQAGVVRMVVVVTVLVNVVKTKYCEFQLVHVLSTFIPMKLWLKLRNMVRK